MNCSPPVPVTEVVSGPVGATGATGPIGPCPTVGTIATQNANNVAISGGYISGIFIMDTNVLSLTPETGYPTGGAVTLRFDVRSLIYIGLTVDATFDIAGMSAGLTMVLILKNTTAGTLNLAWPSWTAAGGTFPATLASGQSMIVKAYCVSNNAASVFAESSL